MKIWKCALMTVIVMAMATSAYAVAPAIGVYFDENATEMSADLEGGVTQMHTAYVFAVNTETYVTAMAFRLELDPGITLMNVETPGGLPLGHPLTDYWIGLAEARSGMGGLPVLGCVMTLWTGDQLLTDAQLRVVQNYHEGGIFITDDNLAFIAVDGLTSYLTIAVASEGSTWGGVKDLYR